MRKHFLILMLMALLPLAGWAIDDPSEPTYPVDLSSGWTIQFVTGATEIKPGTPLATPTATYTGSPVAPQVRLYDEDNNKYIPETKLNVSWSPSPVVDVNGGTAYVVTVTGNTQYTYDELPAKDKTKKFFVLTAENGYVSGKTPLLHGNFTYNGTETPVITNEPEAKFGTILYSVNGGEWSSTIPTAKWPGEYAVKVKVIGTDNYAGINENESATLGTLKITGTTITDFVAPVKKADMDFAWANNAAVEQELVTAGSVALDEHSDVPGIIKFSYSADGPWSADIPKKANVGEYEIFWKIEGQGGYADKDAASLGTVKIKAIAPTITSVATGKTGLVYGGDASAAVGLLSAPAVVTDGAIAKYKVDFKAPGADYGTPSTDVLAYDAVQGKAAGTYKITTLVETAGNYTTVTSPTTIEVTIGQAKAFTSAPTAKAKLVWDYNNDVVDQVLINPAVGAVSGKVEYTMVETPTESDWKQDVNEIKANRAVTYTVKYRVTDPNYEAVPATPIEGVKISKKVVSVIVNDITKTYNNATDLTNDNTTIDNGGTARFTYATLLPGTATYFDALNTADSYVYVSGAGAPKDYKDGGYPGVVTIDPAATDGLNSIASTNNFDYEFNVLPGKLTINKAVVTVTENGDPDTSLKTMFGNHTDISNLWAATTATTISTPEEPWKKVGGVYQKPVLKSEADDVEGEPEADDYALYFVPGTLTDNYMMSTAGANHDGYVITAGHKFVITPDPARKVIITVLPHTQKYTGVAESWANIEEGKDYVVSGLITGDEVTGVTFTRSESDKFDVKYDGPNVVGYTLSADNATIVKDGTPVDMTAKYPGGIVYSNSTFTILPVELTATVDQQTITENADDETKANAAIDKNAWNVEGLVGPDATTGKSVLNGAVAVNITTSHLTDATKKKATLGAGAEGLYSWGLELTIHNGNYTLKDESQYGILRVITDKTLELDPTNADLANNIKAAAKACADSRKNADTSDDVFYEATFANKTLKADTWYTMVLPFAVKATELVNSVKDANGDAVFTIANRLSSATTTGHIVFKLEMKEIPANEPFLIKTAEDVNLQDFSLDDRIIIDATPESPAYDGNKMIGTYENTKINCATGNVLKWLVNEDTPKPADPTQNYDVNNWKICRDYDAPINAMEAYLFENRTVAAALAHPTIITVEDFDGQTTSIKTLNAETMKAYAAEGWYTIDGIKLQSVPTEKGVYINNGKKVVIK